MLRKMLLLLLLGVMIFVTGCWNRRELNDLAIAVGMGIDKQDKQYKVSMQVVVPGEIAAKKGRGASPVTLYSAVGDSVFEAIRKMTTNSPRKIYISHLRILILGEALAREGIGKSLEFLTRDNEARSDFYIAVSKGLMAEDILKVLTSLDAIPANMLYNALETSQKAWAPTTSVTLDELIKDITSEGKHPVLTGIFINGEPQMGNSNKNVQMVDSSAQLQYTSLAVFRGDKLVGWLNEKESKGYNYIRDKVTSTAGVIPCPKGGELTLEIIRSKTKVKGSVIKGKPHIDIEVRSRANVDEVECQIDLTKTKTIAQLESLGDARVKELIDEVIHTVKKEYKADIFGFGDAIRRSNPKFWKKAKGRWDQYFVDLDVTVKVDGQIHQLGTVSNSFLERIRE
ncbi:spore gernimation protein GerC [Paenibacillus selenitireducens]|uniref:Spore gernimation protein GerC n=1 Tax=Paenibacillus selenitireducens TaxID=1324314 RepID=A0A1T2X9I3_9BACL|nr:Ger(x)C family spore germination protein [Paenibacillus selenitireducens]OPA76243.1 spore gernimation protein GerC [Paenibacillus selenitireducens]